MIYDLYQVLNRKETERRDKRSKSHIIEPIIINQTYQEVRKQ